MSNVNNCPACDFHTHILPGMDDGAPDSKMSAEMLRILKSQGVGKVCLTPHFNPDEMKTQEFINRRDAAEKQLSAVYSPPDMPSLLTGAEIYMTEGMSRLDLTPLRLSGTKLLLIEFPHLRFDRWMFDELENIIFSSDSRILIAHVDRVISTYDRSVCDELFEYDEFIFQLNADSLGGFFPNSGIMRYVRPGTEFVLGSDAHNITDRKPDYGKALHRLSGYPYSSELVKIIKKTENKYIK